MAEKKRESIDIILDMLDAIEEKGGEIKPTHLMYRANLSHRQLKSYLEELAEKHLVQKTAKSRYEYISITDDGLRFRQKIREMKEFEKVFGL